MFKFKSLNVICYKFNSHTVPLCFANSVKKKKHVSNECKNTPISILSPIIGKKKTPTISICYGIHSITLKVIFISPSISFTTSCALSHNETS